MADGTEIHGERDLIASLDSAATRLADLDPSEVGQLLVRDAEARAPRDTGYLAGSHDYTATAGALTVYAAAPYAVVVHAREPWLEQTLSADQDQVLDALAETVADTVGQIKGA